MIELSPMRLRFLRHLLATGDAVQAVKLAGYSSRGRSAYVQAAKLLADPHVRAALPVVARALGRALPDLADLPARPPQAKAWGPQHRARVESIVAGMQEMAAVRRLRGARRRQAMANARQALWERRAALGMKVPPAYWTAL